MRAELLPAAFADSMRALLGDEEYTSYIKSFGEDWKPGLRANGLKIRPEELTAILPWRLEPVPWVKTGFYYDGDQARPSRHPAYYAGLYYLQEPSAMTPVELLPVEPGDRVLDLCAAPGGKSTQLGARLLGEGLLVSNDISNSRARALLKNLELAGIPNICVTSESPERLSQVFPLYFDKILVDAPCSGEGMFRRDGEMVKDWALKGPAYYAPLQREILAAAVTMLRPGGTILYSTCTFSREEDEGTVEYALNRFPDLELKPLDTGLVPGACGGIGLDGCMRLFPHRIKGEGHFLALLRKKERGGESVTAGDGGVTAGSAGEVAGDGGAGRLAGDCGMAAYRAGKVAVDSARTGTADLRGKRREKAEARETAKGRGMVRNFPGQVKKGRNTPAAADIEELEAFLAQLSLPVPRERLSVRPEGVYLLPDGMEQPPSLRFLRTGLLLGELKKGRFEPSQALAMALKKEQYPVTVDFPMEDERAVRYLKGETVALAEGEGPVKGWCLVCAGGYPLGWAKGAGPVLKNKYYPGWRWM
ncbi:RsmB/NOP family class I SAM-dependent RNA methyltransferase [Enterocloster asparagiformis]|uniref:NOL1/NOP2/sun family protein n=2 Tax=Enterocloster asparagiformis TaxID=333367 RepID=C0D0J7_9FIRM|nr:RsmB/NOP family class I SAM-dependent RNA methyltransferase [Enterocloster asparagiformis]EEG55143.1 NOL1/NOP2/sun family protein [[Clostridium] asparagiforme DSM 15981]RGX32950.1 SAM-dependent methyltransferase [Enterocloster asparagiformis]UWO74146.1 RsmB/NOP family class I SAM-dependent RNA methyltransferase [[Clostridium] asparagiforme DSM 15981]